MSNAQEPGLKALNDLIATCHDAEEGYAKAAKGVHDRALSDRLTDISGERGRFAEELRTLLSKSGVQASTDAHFGGILHRGWVDLETQLRSKDDHEILQECRHGDEGTLKHYQHALEQQLSDEGRAVVERQRNAIHAELNTLRGLTKRAAHA